jgi:hypothetical protein
MGLYHGSDCSCSTGHGPCCIASPLDASDASDAPVDGTSCAPPNILRYETAGCGASAHPVCGPSGSSGPDVCAQPICSCDGRTITKCDYSAVPWAYAGICQPGESGADAVEQ